MKYIIIPIIQFIWALALTIIGLPFTVIFTIILDPLWNWEKPDFTFKITRQVDISPYFEGKNINYFGVYTFKSYYHYIWGVGLIS